MTHTRRISPQEVLEAYGQTGISPGHYCNNCALAVVMKVEGADVFSMPNGWTRTQLKWIEKEIGAEYKGGFCNAFDGYRDIPNPTDSPRYKEGMEDGILVRKEVFQL